MKDLVKGRIIRSLLINFGVSSTDMRFFSPLISMNLEKSREIAPKGMKRLSQSGNNAQLWMYLVVKVMSNALKNNIA